MRTPAQSDIQQNTVSSFAANTNRAEPAMKGILKRLKAILPTSLKQSLRWMVTFPYYWTNLRRNYAYDRARFNRYSSADTRLDRRIHLESWIAGDLHKIEKGLALSSPRPGFGAAVVSRLIENLSVYLKQYRADENCTVALNVLNEYREFNVQNGIENPDLNAKLQSLSAQLAVQSSTSVHGGTIEICRKAIQEQSCIDLEPFLSSRHSIRHFSNEPVPQALIERAVGLALKTPSVCNRQSWKVHAFDNPGLKQQVISCQQGNSGFGETIATVLVVTSDTETFFSIGERNQCWVDGGMFSMSLVYALHSLGLGTICLNWSVEKETDIELHRVASLRDSEAVIMLIGVGYLPDKLRVAESVRKPSERLLSWNGNAQ